MVSLVHDLAVVLGVAAATTVLFRVLRQPSVLGYLLAGLIVGPYVPIPLFADPERMHVLSELGVVLVMFAIGLEFRIKSLLEVLPVSGATALIQISVLFWCGFSIGGLLGWTTVESLFIGGSIAISSTMVVSKVFAELRPSTEVRSFVLGILVLQDVAAVVLIAVMTGVASGGGLSAPELAATLARLAGVLLLFLAAGMLVVPPVMRAVGRLDSAEVLVVVSTGTCFAFAAVAEATGYSVALGAFIAGMVVAESGRGEGVEHATRPLKDVFAAIFFVSTGMSIDPVLAAQNLGAALLVFVVVVVAQLVSVSIGGLLSGGGLRKSVTAGLALGQIGEFAFIISAIGVTAGVARPSIQPILVTVAVLTAFTTPLLLSRAESVWSFVDRHLPKRLQNLFVYYETLFERVRAAAGSRSSTRKAIRAIAIDAVALIALVILWVKFSPTATDAVASSLSVAPVVALVATGIVVLVVGMPFAVGFVRNSLRLGTLVADAATMSNRGSTPSAARPLIRSTVFALLVLGVGFPAAATLRPVLHFPYVFLAVMFVWVVAAVFVWRRAGRIDEETRSGAERVVELFAQQDDDAHEPTAPPFVMPDILTVEIGERDACVGRTLAELNLRARTGASVLAIHRRGEGLVVPSAKEPLAAGDVLAIAGSPDARQRARQALCDAASTDPAAHHAT